MLVIVSYDVSTLTSEGRRRLRRVARACLDYGQRVQNSVFECNLDNATWILLQQRLMVEVNLQEDSLRFYFLGNNWHGKVEHHGGQTYFRFGWRYVNSIVTRRREPDDRPIVLLRFAKVIISYL